MNAGYPQNPLHIANVAQRMADNTHGTNSLIFQNVAMVSMGVVAVASVVQVLAPLLKDLTRKHDDHKGDHKGRGWSR